MSHDTVALHGLHDELTGDAWTQRVSAWSSLACTLGQLACLRNAMIVAGPIRTAVVLEEMRRDFGLEPTK